MSEDQVEKELKMYQELAKKDKSIDVAALMISALEKNRNTNSVPLKQKRLAYIISFAFPPFGLIYAVKFYFSGYDDGKSTALACSAITAVTILMLVIISFIMFSGSGTSLEQFQQIRPEDIKSLVE